MNDNNKNKHRILVLTSTYPRWKGDAVPRFILDLCKYMSRHADILVLAPHADGAATDEILEGVHIKRFRYFIPGWESLAYENGILNRIRDKPLRILQIPFFLFFNMWQVRKIIATWRPSVIHAHWLIPQALIAAITGRGKTAILCTSHGSDLYALDSGVMNYVKKTILSSCKAVTVVNQVMAERVLELCPEAYTKVIPMGTDLQHTFIPPKYEYERSIRTILFVGRLMPTKGVIDLLEVFCELLKMDEKLELVIVGDGPLRAKILYEVKKRDLSENVCLPGQLPHDQLARYYRTATVSVYPFSPEEGFGLVAIEAMGCGCPVIAYDVPGLKNTIEHNHTGMLVPYGDTEALKDTIRKCMADEQLRARLARTARDYVVNKYDWQLIANRYIELFDELVAVDRASG